MSGASKSSVYEQVVKITRVYLGPAADRFISRQVENHLNKASSQLTARDLEKLIDWIKLSVSMLTEDGEIIEEYIKELSRLVPGNRRSK